MIDLIRKQGAAAAAQGKFLLDCPYLRLRRLPFHSGESISSWRAKLESWETGWHSHRTDARNRS